MARNVRLYDFHQEKRRYLAFANDLHILVPRKPVIFGNTAGLGPEIDYHDPEMLVNKTRMREIHRNWQVLFPRES